MDWESTDRWLVGEAWIGSTLSRHLAKLSDDIGVRWAGTANEQLAAQYVVDQFRNLELAETCLESYDLATSNCQSSSLQITAAPERPLATRPCLFCPSISTEAPLVDVGFGMPHELAAWQECIPGSIVLVRSEFEPFSDPEHLTIRLQRLAAAGAIAALTPSSRKGRQLHHISAGDWRDEDLQAVPLPLVQITWEDAQLLSRCGEVSLRLRVETTFDRVPSWNAIGTLPGHSSAGGEIILAAHHDTTPDSPGGNDNGAGVAVLLETARLLQQAQDSLSVAPGCPIRFISFGGEEQGLQGSTAYVQRHFSAPAQLPRFMLALDELATGPVKGVVLQFPELRNLIQQQLNTMDEGLQCHVLSQLDASGDMFPFARHGIPVSFLWRWRFAGRHPDTAFGHSSSDTYDKVRIRELKEYAAHLSRLLLRLSHISKEDWPENTLDVGQIETRIQQERGAVFRTM